LEDGRVFAEALRNRRAPDQAVDWHLPVMGGEWTADRSVS
jgi:hypothetical protein